jgi:hypothetical protein
MPWPVPICQIDVQSEAQKFWCQQPCAFKYQQGFESIRMANYKSKGNTLPVKLILSS